MKYTFNRFVLFLSLFTFSCSSKFTSVKIEDVGASSLHPLGRYAFTNRQLELITSAANFGFTFAGKECSIFANINNPAGHNYLQYELDGVYQKKVRIEGNTRLPIVVTAAGEKTHTIRIYKATEASTGPIFIEKVRGKNIKPLALPEAALIEFIGNSITCGAVADASEIPCEAGEYHDHHNAYYAYGPRLARALNVNFIVSSVSGIGIYRNWNSDGPAMPQVYEKTDFVEGGQRLWNFNTFTPAVVSIALGTNDYSNGDGKKQRAPFDSATFVGNYIKFVQLVKAKYPQAQIALLSSPMITGDRRLQLQNCILAVKNNIGILYSASRKVAVYFFKPMQAKGCSGHPSVEDHAILANELLPFFKSLLNK